jgi:hypothetical protein
MLDGFTWNLAIPLVQAATDAEDADAEVKRLAKEYQDWPGAWPAAAERRMDFAINIYTAAVQTVASIPAGNIAELSTKARVYLIAAEDTCGIAVARSLASDVLRLLS